MEHRFKIHLEGIIEILANHLYSSPAVFVRELLQNAVDALRARDANPPNARIELEVTDGERPVLSVIDTGVGLTEDEVHDFLATIGRSSKREALEHMRSNFIGQFGIGILSCFMVAEEIVVITKSAGDAAPALEWRGKQDGTYELKHLEGDFQPGTRVYLRARPGQEHHFQAGTVRKRALLYGSMLPFPLILRHGENEERLDRLPPWEFRSSGEFADASSLRSAEMEFARRAFHADFLDVIPLDLPEAGVAGLAFVIAQPVNPAGESSHRIYLKNMLISEKRAGLIPEWAFFVQCVVNTQRLRPTASRESFYVDEHLEAASLAVGARIKEYLADLALRHPDRFESLLYVHGLALHATAAQDDAFFRIMAPHLSVDTSLGRLSIAECADRGDLEYVTDIFEYRQVAPLAAARGACVINAGYVYVLELLEKYRELIQPDVVLRPVRTGEFMHNLAEVDVAERDEFFDLLRLSDRELQRFQCRAEVRRFSPPDMPAVYALSDEARRFRRARESRDLAQDTPFSEVLDAIAGRQVHDGYASLYFNYDNELLRRLAARAKHGDALIGHAVRTIYVQALLLGHHALRPEELRLANESLLGLMDIALREGD